MVVIGAHGGVTNMLTNHLQALLDAGDRVALCERSVRVAEYLGFPLISMTAVVEVADGDTLFDSIGNTPPEHLEAFDDVARGRRDPTAQYLKRASLPMHWDRSTYADSSASDLWEEQAAFGYEAGICTGLHLPRGRHFMFGVDGPSTASRRSAERLDRLLADVHLFASYAQVAAERLMFPKLTVAPTLSTRERDCLGWTLCGKTAWEVGMILGLSERTANQYLANATRKLGCANKHQAAAKALRLGLVPG